MYHAKWHSYKWPIDTGLGLKSAQKEVVAGALLSVDIMTSWFLGVKRKILIHTLKELQARPGNRSVICENFKPSNLILLLLDTGTLCF